MMVGQWLVDETTPLDQSAIAELDRQATRSVRGASPRVAVLLREVIVHDVHKLFGAANVRLDALVVHGRNSRNQQFYMPATFRFPSVKDHDSLPIDENGLLIFDGNPLHFLDLSITASRDTTGADDLATLLSRELSNPKTQGAVGALLALGVAAPAAATIAGAVSAAAVLGDIAYRLVRAATGNTIGVYRGSFLQFRDAFGVGKHPGDGGRFRVKDLEFSYDTVLDEALPS